jgi:endonuclease III related protein
MNTTQRLSKIFGALLAAFGKRDWWPGDSPLEIAVGAVLTQNTAWKNVEKAILRMKESGTLDLKRLHLIEEQVLAEIIRPAGFYNVKAKRLKNMAAVLFERCEKSMEGLNAMGTEEARSLLLSVNGVGPETADSILLYALDRPIFVVDAYTKRLVRRHHLITGAGDYDYREVQEFFHDHLPADAYLYNEFHALIVALCQRYCKKAALCENCPLQWDLEDSRP